MKKLLFLALGGTMFLSSCSLTNRTMREPNSRVDFTRADFDLSQQFRATATSTRIIGIDWSRLFKAEQGAVNKDGSAMVYSVGDLYSSVPVVGGAINMLADRTQSFALYNLMNEHPGYDVVFYPSFTSTVQRPIGLGIYTITTVEVTARLAKLK